jgi:transposase-like protein
MSLLSMYRRDDSRAVYRILAEQAIKHLDQPTAARESKILFTNIARLLERYRYDAFSYDVAPGILEVFNRKSDAQYTNYGSSDKTLDVISALEAAHARVYGGISKDALVESLEQSLTQLATAHVPDDQETKDHLAKMRLFFVALLEGLKERPA